MPLIGGREGENCVETLCKTVIPGRRGTPLRALLAATGAAAWLIAVGRQRILAHDGDQPCSSAGGRPKSLLETVDIEALPAQQSQRRRPVADVKQRLLGQLGLQPLGRAPPAVYLAVRHVAVRQRIDEIAEEGDRAFAIKNPNAVVE